MFLDKWKDEALVVDKWFRVQATSWLPGTLERVKALTAHPAFDLRNPNRARALLHAFAMDNPLHFHAADGSGYRWVAEQVVALDRLNPQVASRLARAFDRWKKYDAGPPGARARGARVDPRRRGTVRQRGRGRGARAERPAHRDPGVQAVIRSRPRPARAAARVERKGPLGPVSCSATRR